MLEHATELSSTPQAAYQGNTPDYWECLIPETEAAEFLDLTRRSLQRMRQRGGGPRYIRVGPRCIKYTRRMLKSWADARIRKSTSDPGPNGT